MRPRKIVLVVDTDPDELGRRAFLLETRGLFLVLRASSAESAIEFMEKLPQGHVCVLVTEYDLGTCLTGEDLAARARLIDPEIKTLVTSRTRDRWTSLANMYLTRGAATPGAVLGMVLALAARRRGPKLVLPETPLKPQASLAAARA